MKFQEENRKFIAQLTDHCIGREKRWLLAGAGDVRTSGDFTTQEQPTQYGHDASFGTFLAETFGHPVRRSIGEQEKVWLRKL
ncbi:hypothetical protein [Paraburkholderia ribeironis]|uniref:hypothetical protein n=1 Tax=Paraburkholderia ribeironis TaxID=1247936 RepID=UPI000B9D5347|nr:hypothetical protein [Paraburkholderia ribeironis]